MTTERASLRDRGQRWRRTDNVATPNEVNPVAANWGDKGATLTYQTAQKEFGLSETEIFDAIRAGTLQYRETSIHGNPALRLLRREVETFVRKARGAAGFRKQKVAHELAQVQKELRSLKRKMRVLEKRKAQLLSPAAAKT